MTTKSMRSITSRRMSARVMYRLSTVSYNRLFGYFLIVRGSLMAGPSLWVVVAPSLVQGVSIYHITSAPRTEFGKRGGFPQAWPAGAGHTCRTPWHTSRSQWAQAHSSTVWGDSSLNVTGDSWPSRTRASCSCRPAWAGSRATARLDFARLTLALDDVGPGCARRRVCDGP